MKLQKLIISAFGPYSDKQILDFETYLDGKNMFVISGNTGSGKTTIFDAINFALYGNASGSERDGKSLRSDFSSPDTDTEVELWFSIRDKEYYIKRCPQYDRAKLRGEGITRKAAYAEMKSITDNIILTGYNDVSTEIEKILGINSAQFKQLVMIPQGEFKKLLNADSREKEIIFRKIFATETFEQIQKQIVEKSNILSSQIGDFQKNKEHTVTRFIHEDDSLKELLIAPSLNYINILNRFKSITSNDNKDKSELDKELLELNNNLDGLKKILLKSEEDNKKLEYLNIKRKNFEILDSQKNNFDIKSNLFYKAKKASELKIYEEKYQNTSSSLNKRKIILLNLENDITNLENLLKDSDIELQHQKKREAEKLQLTKALDKILRLKERSSEFAQNNIALTQVESEIKNFNNAFNDNQKKYVETENTIKNLIENIEQINILSLENLKLENELNAQRELYTKINLITTSSDRFKETLAKHTLVTFNFDKIETDFKSAKKRFEDLDDDFKKNQAGILASTLISGNSCPVCGSLEHPNPAKLDAFSISESDVKKAKLNLENTSKLREDIFQKLTSLKQDAEFIKHNLILPSLKEILELDDFKNIDDFYEILISMKTEITEKGKFTKNKFDKNVQIIAEKDALLTQKKQNELMLLSLKEKEKAIQKNLEYKKIEASSINEKLNAIKLEFDGEIQKLELLEKQEHDIKLSIKLIEDALNLAENVYKELKAKFDNLSGQKKALEVEITNLESECKISNSELEAMILKLEFKDLEDYKSHYLQKSELELLEYEITSFNQSLKSAETAFNDALENSQNIYFTELEKITELIKQKKSDYEKLDSKLKNLEFKILNNQKIIEELEILTKKTYEFEEKFKSIGHLANIIKGENTAKISFERYVLSSYYEDIITAANLRFSKMTMGRFELSRKQEVSDARKKSGLDLEVFDNYTGKSRDIKTLSGGESFKASLSMALGLADVVQSYSGGIQLDTMFIDEGFGTLDPESLDKAIECLIELQYDGRVVGIISHVPELKERIDAKLEVSMTNSGSKAEFKID